MAYLKRFVVISIFLVIFISFSIHANQTEVLAQETGETVENQNDSSSIENTWIITFKDVSELPPGSSTRPLIDPPDESKRGLGIVPFGEPSSGQTREDLAARMGLQGEVLHILDELNAAVVSMSAEEAERWRQDERVEYIEPDILLTSFGTETDPDQEFDGKNGISGALDNTYTYHGGYPVYDHKTGTLTIPRVDAPGQVGQYQDVVFQLDTQLDLWILKEHQFRDNNATDLQVSVFPYVRSGYFSIPDQLEVQISGNITCSRIGQINHRRTDNLFEIQVTPDPLKPGEVCNQKTEFFQRTLQLDISRLQAGEYQVSVNNGASTASFTLPVDTIVPDECGGNPENDDSNCDAVFSGEVIESRNDDRGGYPVYNAEDGILTLPRVDVPDQVGRYQNVILRFDAQRSGWILDEVQLRKHSTMGPEFLNVFLSVTAIDSGLIPYVTLHVAGEYTCGQIGQINQRRTGNQFEIQITKDPLKPDEVCDQVARPFKRTIQLEVFRLQAGEYHYTLNSTIFTTAPGFSTGDEFILPFDTTPLQDCGGSPEIVVDCTAIIF